MTDSNASAQDGVKSAVEEVADDDDAYESSRAESVVQELIGRDTLDVDVGGDRATEDGVAGGEVYGKVDAGVAIGI